MRSVISAIVGAIALAGFFTVVTRPGEAQQRAGAADDSVLRFRFMGPSVGNRVASVVGIPGDPKIYYAGAASGGVWKSTDGGTTFTPIFDGQAVAAIGALAVAPSSPGTVWA